MTTKPPSTGVKPATTTASEEWGDRVDTARAIARGGQTNGTVAGAVGDDVHDPRAGKASPPDVGVPDGLTGPLTPQGDSDASEH